MGRRRDGRPGRRARPPGTGVPDAAVGAARGALGEPGGLSVAGGYRLVRVLGEGEHGVVHLGHATAAAAAEAGAAEEEPRSAAVKIHRESVPPDWVDREIEALGRVVHPHALHLDDLATLPDGRVSLIVERVGGRGLGRLVAENQEIGAGEAVTILAPIVDAVRALHAGGVAHGRIRLSNVLFRDNGAPVLVGFGHATLFPRGSSAASLVSNPAVLQDRRQLATLVQSVLDRGPARPPRRSRVDSSTSRRTSTTSRPGWSTRSSNSRHRGLCGSCAPACGPSRRASCWRRRRSSRTARRHGARRC